MAKTNKERIGDLETDVKTLQQNSTPKWVIYLGLFFSIVSLLVAGVSAYSAWSIDQKTPDLIESKMIFPYDNRTVETANESFYNVSFLINNSGKRYGEDIVAYFDINESYSIVDYGYIFEDKSNFFNKIYDFYKDENSLTFRFNNIARNNVTIYIMIQSPENISVPAFEQIFNIGELWESGAIRDYLIDRD